MRRQAPSSPHTITGWMTIFVCAWLTAGCASTVPLSRVQGMPGSGVDSVHFGVQVIAIDGALNTSAVPHVAPGPRWLVLQAAPARSAGRVPQKAIVLRVEPCKHYFLAARRESPFNSDWEPVVLRTEDVTPCDPAEEMKKAGAGNAQISTPPRP